MQQAMEYIALFFFAIMWYSPTIYAANSKAYLEPKNILTQVGASYVIMLKHDTVSPVECYINNTKQTFSVDLFREGNAPVPINQGNRRDLLHLQIQPRADTDIVTSLGNGICGFKMDLVSKDTPYIWNISFVDQSKNTYHAELRTVVRPVYPRHLVKYVRIGSYLHINCIDAAAGDLEYEIVYCRIFNPQNEQIKLERKIRSCSHVVETAKLKDFGVWRCEQIFESSMEPTIVIHEFIPIKTNVVQTWSNTTNKYLNIGCKVINATNGVKYCVMTRPDGYEITLKPGLATKRYTAIGTSFENHICSMQIKLPLEKQEKGLWRCEERYEPYNPLGGFISVSMESTSYVAAPKVPKNVLVHINSTLKLTCSVPYSSPYCYMRSPDGYMYPLSDDRLNSLGICEFSKEKAQITDNGTWICGFAKDTGEPDDVLSFEVYVPEQISIQSPKQEIEARSAGMARLMCGTNGLGDYPIQYCRFLSPEGKIYQIGNHETSDRISYEGRGFEYGECGIILQDVSESDQGTWSCITRIQKVTIIGTYEATEEVYTNIHLSVKNNLALASSLGISFGVVAVVTALLVYAIYRYQKRHNFLQTFVNFHRRNSHTSDTSGPHDVALNIRQESINYNATDSSNIRIRNVENPAEIGHNTNSNDGSLI